MVFLILSNKADQSLLTNITYLKSKHGSGGSVMLLDPKMSP